jgi:signal transduction histidine kinase
MSYLLHPPLLDEAGFEAAAHWFIDGFAKRTAMAIKTNFSHPHEPPAGLSKTPRMPEVVELALFRALQEGLTNAHRHSASPHVEVKFQRLPDRAVLEIQDFGRGVPPTVMDRFLRTGTGSGVGLSGIRERVKELGGDFTIESTDAGTTLRSTVPLCSDADRTEPRSEARDASAPNARSHNLATNVNRAS